MFRKWSFALIFHFWPDGFETEPFGYCCWHSTSFNKRQKSNGISPLGGPPFTRPTVTFPPSAGGFSGVFPRQVCARACYAFAGIFRPNNARTYAWRLCGFSKLFEFDINARYVSKFYISHDSYYAANVRLLLCEMCGNSFDGMAPFVKVAIKCECARCFFVFYIFLYWTYWFWLIISFFFFR